MKKIRAIIVDDEEDGITSLQTLLKLHCPQVEIVDTCQHASEAIDSVQELHPDLVFLDIRMPGKNGFDMLRELDGQSFEIIFVTAYSDYMIQAFRYSAIDYLMKPIEEDLLEEAVKRAGERIEQKSGQQQVETFLHNVRHLQQPRKMKLCIPSVRGFQVLDLDDILYCEASSSYTNFHFAHRGIVCASKPIHEYETLLEDSHFLRIHKSYVVNIEYITEYVRGDGGYVILSDGKQIEVSRRKKDALISRMREHYKF